MIHRSAVVFILAVAAGLSGQVQPKPQVKADMPAAPPQKRQALQAPAYKGPIVEINMEKRLISIALDPAVPEAEKEIKTFIWDANTRIYSKTDSLSLKELQVGWTVKVFYSRAEGEALIARRIMAFPPSPDAPTQPGGTGN